MVYVIIQVPCYNEEETLSVTLHDLPKLMPGVHRLDVQIIDDGCTDNTVAVARSCGVHHIVSMGHNQGLAKAFLAGIENALALGADVIVNTDADNQYNAADIQKLISPILANEADIVVGARPIRIIKSFSRTKKLLQSFGSWVVRQLSGTKILDAPSGFRALSRKAAKRLNVYSEYTYTLETLIQAGQSNLRVVSVPVEVNDDLRPSRLVKSIPRYVMRSMGTIIRSHILYQPLRFFACISALFGLAGGFLIARFLYFYFTEAASGYVQSVVIGSGACVIALLVFLFGAVADLISVNRRLLEEIRVRVSDLERDQRSEYKLRDAA